MEKISRVNVCGLPRMGKTELCRAVGAWLVSHGVVEHVLEFAHDRRLPRTSRSLITLASNLFDLNLTACEDDGQRRAQFLAALQVHPAPD